MTTDVRGIQGTTRGRLLKRVNDALTTAGLDGAGDLAVLDPDDESVVALLPRQDALAVDRAVARAARFQSETPILPRHERVRILEAVADIVRDEREIFTHAIASEGIKTVREAAAEVNRCIETLRLSAMAVHTVVGQIIPMDVTSRLASHTGYYQYRPLGVVAALTPYNDPLNLVAHKIGPALAAGNSTVLRPDERTPLSALLLCDAFWRAGTPLARLQIVIGAGQDVVPALVGDRRVQAITATGGDRLARAIEGVTGARRVVLELGGVCPAIVTRSADLDLAAAKIGAAAYGAAGQNCLHPQAVLVEEPVHEEFLRLLSRQVSKVAVGPKDSPDTDMGPLIDQAATARVDALVTDALERGAAYAAKGLKAPSRLHRELVVLRDVPDDAHIWRDEVFGPVTATRAVADFDQALRAAAQTTGLQASVFTARLDESAAAVAGLPHAGVVINDTDMRFDGMPFGGNDSAGLGREGPAFAVAELSSIQSVHHSVSIM
ncbi:aldehyde dehydrogenase family protein [Streptomyces werraensis]|uniref:aldehyde dehydrogenase family protein n=1 Tax=Streptomyces werraensis TaxID=68284 RepID=UPI001CE318A9